MPPKKIKWGEIPNETEMEEKKCQWQMDSL